MAGRLVEEEIRLRWGGVQDLLAELTETTRLLSEVAPEDRYDFTHGTFPTVSLLLQRSTSVSILKPVADFRAWALSQRSRQRST